MPFIKTQAIGRLTRDVELRVTPGGKAICQFGLAVNSKFGQTEDVVFIDVEAWEKRAETVAKYFKKGDPIYIEGRIKQDTWDDKTTGQKRSKIKIVLDNFEFIGGKKEESGDPGAYTPPAQDQSIERHTPPARTATKPTPPPQDNIDEDVPF